MEKLDDLIKQYLIRKTKGVKLEPTERCPSEVKLCRYLEGTLSATQKLEMESHIADCFFCLEQLEATKKGEAIDMSGKATITEQVDLLAKWVKKHKWLLGAVVAFMASFLFPRFFLQFLVAVVIMGGKWILESRQEKTLIMIYDAWQRGDRDKVEGMFEDLGKRLQRR